MMNRFMIKKLVQKDWYMCRYSVYGCLVLGYTGLISSLLGGFYGTYLGWIALDIAIIMLMYFQIFSVVIFERKDQTMPFIMSLRVSNLEFTVAKTLIGLGSYFCTWLLLYISAIAVLVIRLDITNSLIPYFTMLYTAALMFYCFGFAVVMITESEPLTNLVLALGNITIQVSIGLGMSFEAIKESLRSPTILWNTPIVSVLTIEAVVIVLSIAAIFYFQARKKDFL